MLAQHTTTQSPPTHMLWCPAYEHTRKKNLALQQPFEDGEGKFIGRILFESNIAETKETINEF